MRRRALALGVGLLLGACRGAGPALVDTASDAGVGDETKAAAHGERPIAFDVGGFEPPFGRVPVSEAFVREHGLRRIVVHEDANTEDARLVDVKVTTFDYDRAGRVIRVTTVDRGEPGEEVLYDYEDERLVAEVHVFAHGTRHVIRYAHDAAGRVERVERELPQGTIEEHRAYDERGRPSVVTRSEGGGRAEQRFVYEGEQLRREELRLPEGREIVTERSYGANGRPTRWVTTDSTAGVDTYELAWDARGQLRALAFTDDDTLIYRRTYAYDEDGRPLREELRSFVPAMGRGSVLRYEYERHDEPRREAVAASKSEPTKAELLAATMAAFPGAYEELAVVAYEAWGEGRFTPGSVTVYIPEAIVRRLSAEALKQQACVARKMLAWDCDCEWVTLGEPVDHAWHSWADKRVVPLTFHLGLGC